MSQLLEFGLQPDSVHFELLSPIDLEPSVHLGLDQLEPVPGKQVGELFEGEKVAQGPVSPGVKVVPETLSRLDPQLGQVLPAIVPEVDVPARLEVGPDVGQGCVHARYGVDGRG